MASADFRRARHPDQVQVRRDAILDSARAMLDERSVADISLRELSDRVGLAKSNVLRYFESREAILLEILDAVWKNWLDRAEERLRRPPRPAARPFARESHLAAVVADTLADEPVLCELISVMTNVLERNIGADFARDFKLRAAANNSRLAVLVRTGLPELSAQSSELFAATTWVLIAGLWPYCNPTETVARVAAELNMPHSRESFAADLGELLKNQLVGLTCRSTAEAGTGTTRRS